MKNTLLCTTTLAMTGFAGMASAANIEAGALTVGVGGYFTQHVAYSSVGGVGVAGADFDGIDLLTNAEIHFKPSLTLDNGITIGAHVELEGGSGTAPSDPIDESYFYAKGDFGQVIVGSENSAGYKMSYAAPDVSHIYANSTSLTSFVPFSGAGIGNDIFRGTLGATYIENGRNNDANRISYFSPRFSGFQVGISYARDGGQGNGAVNNTTNSLTDIIDIAANYTGSFGGVDVAASARWGTADQPGALPSAEIWGVGGTLGWNGFTIGGSFVDQDGTALMDGQAGDLGISYSDGGAMSYSLTYFKGTNQDNEAAVGVRETLENIVLATNYAVADNFSVGAYIASVDFVENPGALDNSTDGIVVGVSASFSF